MARIDIGDLGFSWIQQESILPGFNFLDDTNFGTGSHSFSVATGSAVYVDGTQQAFPGTNDFAGFIADFASSWTIQINGVIRTDLGDDGGLGLFLANGGSTGLGAGLTRVTVGSDGGIFGKAVGIQANTAFNLTNSGAITGDYYAIYTRETAAYDAFGDQTMGNLELGRVGGPRTITVTNTADGIISGGQSAILNDTLSALVVSNAGQITGGQRAVDFTGDSAEYTFTNAFGVGSYGRLTLTNAATGTIDGGIMGAWLGSSVTNAGTINGTVEMVFLDEFLENGRVDVNRDGDVTDAGDFLLADPRLVGMTLTNSGILNGFDQFYLEDDPLSDDPDAIIATQVAFDGSGMREVVNNTATGTIYGQINLYGGQDSVTNAGLIVGVIATDADNDTVTNAATGVIDSAYNNGVVDVAVHTGAGSDSFTNAGLVAGYVVMSDGNDTLSNTGTLENANLDLMFDDAGAVKMVQGADGNDSALLGNGGVMNGALYLGFGNNTVTNAGRIAGEAIEFVENGRQIDAVIVGRAGNDALSNTGSILGAVDLGAGADRVVNSGRILADALEFADVASNPNALSLIDLGLGNDSLTNSGEIGEVSALYSGNRKVASDLLFELLRLDDTNLGAAINMGAGDDVLTNIAGRVSGKIYGHIAMGAGDDTLTGGAFNEIVSDEDGRDLYSLGAGADGIFLRSYDTFADTMNGGQGNDVVNFGLTQIDATTDNGHIIDLAGGRVIYQAASATDTVGGGHGIDVIREFEQVLGSDGDDFIFGGAANETLIGGAGNDVIAGGLGRDSMVGGDDADRFVFNLAAHSGAAGGPRDIIRDFSTAQGDKIVLNFDSNTQRGSSNAGIQTDFQFNEMNSVLWGDAGLIRAYYVGQTTVVEVDTNADQRADFALVLQWSNGVAINLSESDFIFGPLG